MVALTVCSGLAVLLLKVLSEGPTHHTVLSICLMVLLLSYPQPVMWRWWAGVLRVSSLLITPHWAWLLTVHRVSVPRDTTQDRYSVTYLWDIPTPGVTW